VRSPSRSAGSLPRSRVLDLAHALPAVASLALGVALTAPSAGERARRDVPAERSATTAQSSEAPAQPSEAPDPIAVITHVMRNGTDRERSLAVDGLAAAGCREALVPALNDRLDAVAAKAALAYVGTNRREDYRVALAPFVDEARVEALLALLAGYLA